MKSTMKRTMAICMTVIMVVCMSVTAFAASNGFVTSPSVKPAPTLNAFTPKDAECTAELVITPYGEREELSDEDKAAFEKAYNDIVSSDSVADLNEDLAKKAAEKGIDKKDLAASDLFHLDVKNCNPHDPHHGFDVVLDADALKNFVGLLQLTADGKWELVSGAEVINDGKSLKFFVNDLTDYAIIVDTTAPSQSGGAHQTGDMGYLIPVYVAVMAVCAVAIVLIVRKIKKKEA